LGRGDRARGGVDSIQRVVECARPAFADGEAWYGAPAVTDVPLADLLSPRYAAQRRALVGRSASRDLRPGSPGGARPRLPGFVAGPRQAALPGIWPGQPTLADGGGTRPRDAPGRVRSPGGGNARR